MHRHMATLNDMDAGLAKTETKIYLSDPKQNKHSCFMLRMVERAHVSHGGKHASSSSMHVHTKPHHA